MNYDDIKSHKKPLFQPLFRRYILRKSTGGEGHFSGKEKEMKLICHKSPAIKHAFNLILIAILKI